MFSNFICEIINNSIQSSIFPSCLKHADVTTFYKKSDKILKENYRPVSMDGNWFWGAPRINTLYPLVQHFPCRFVLHYKGIGIGSYADDHTVYTIENDVDNLIVSLEETSKFLFTFFDNNLIKINAEKYLLLLSYNEKVTIKTDSQEAANAKREKL